MKRSIIKIFTFLFLSLTLFGCGGGAPEGREDIVVWHWMTDREDAFLELLCKADSPKKILEILGEEYKLGYHKAAKMAQIGVRAEMWAVTDLDDDIVKKSQLKPYSDIQTALDDAVKVIKSKEKKPRIVVMPFGSLTVPLI